jgi:RND family efflux transporter MFP subunit
MTNKGTCFFLILLFLVPGCSRKRDNPGKSEPEIPVVTSLVEINRAIPAISLSGNIEGYKTVRLGFMVAGKIDYISSEEGGLVSKNRLLASLDPESYNLAKELADIQVNQARDEYDRLKSMYDKKSLSESDFVKISSGLQQAETQQKLHTKNLADTKLFSPIDGVLLKRLAEVGEITGAGIPLFVVSDIRKIKVSAFIPENELHNIKLGQKAKVIVSSLNGTFEGKIIEVGSAADPASRTFSVKIEIDNPGLLIRPGMIAEISVQAGQTAEIVTGPVEAIQHDYDDRTFVYIADTLKGRAFRRNVTPGNILNNRIEIVSGLSEGERIITGGQQKLVDGSMITINK